MDVTKDRNDFNITLSNPNPLENVGKFVYLGSIIINNGGLTPELDNRIGKAANAFNKLLPVMCHKSITLRTKKGYLLHSSTFEPIVWCRKLEHHHSRRETARSISHKMPSESSWCYLARPSAKRGNLPKNWSNTTH